MRQRTPESGAVAEGGEAMTDESMRRDQPPPGGASPAHIPFMQRLLDNPFLLLFLGVTVPAVLYLMWGVMEVANIPIAR
jgi:hypothetical protein